MDLFQIKYGLHQQIERQFLSRDVKNQYILDVGCGGGWIEKMLIKKGIIGFLL